MILSTASLASVTAAPSIIEDIDFLVKSNAVSFPVAQKLRIINKVNYDVTTDILKYQSNWEFDDTNKTDFPIATTNLVASQKDYALPTSMVKLLRMEVKDSAGNWQRVRQFDETQVDQALTEFNKSTGLPRLYREIGNSIELYPSPDASSTTLTSGLKCYYQRVITDVTTSDASVEPGFAKQFHPILSVGAAYEYAIINQLEVAPALRAKLEELRLELREYYSSRNREVKPTLKVTKRNYE
mgnify:CR=1 FL=1